MAYIDKNMPQIQQWVALTLLITALFSAKTIPGALAARPEVTTLDAIMPPHPTQQVDEYLCTTIELPDAPMKLVGIEPLADQATVHHMLLFGKKNYYFSAVLSLSLDTQQILMEFNIHVN